MMDCGSWKDGLYYRAGEGVRGCSGSSPVFMLDIFYDLCLYNANVNFIIGEVLGIMREDKKLGMGSVVSISVGLVIATSWLVSLGQGAGTVGVVFVFSMIIA